MPRVVLFPAYVVSEYVLRRPFGYLMVAAEKGEWVQELQNIFTFGPNDNIGVIPTALLDFGFRASAGVYFFYDDMGFSGNAFRVHAATGGTDWLRLTAADRISLDDHTVVAIRGEAWTRPDWVFAGIGAKSLEADSARYQATSFEGGVAFRRDFGTASAFDAYTNIKSIDFEDICCEPTVGWRVANGRYPLPPAFDTGYTAHRIGARLALDSRRPRPAPGHGARIELSGEHAVDVRMPQVRRWIHYGATLGGFVDLTGQNRVVSLALSTDFVDPLGSEQVPFTELVPLGGDAPMRGFREGRLRGRSAAALTLEYRYPIWAFLDGSAQVAVGNVFDKQLSDFALDLTRLSFEFGLRTNGARDHSFDILIGSATETFQQGAELQEVRFLFGATRGF